MSTKREGAAIRQDTRAYGYPATRRTPHISLPEWQNEEEWGTAKTVLASAVGTLFLFSFMWLAAAY